MNTITSKQYQKLYNKQSEHTIQDAIIRVLLLKKYMVIRFNSGAFSSETERKDGTKSTRFVRFYTIANNKKSAGLSDVWFGKDGKCTYIEVKSKTGRLSKNQEEFIELCNRFKMPIIVADNWEYVLDYVEKL